MVPNIIFCILGNFQVLTKFNKDKTSIPNSGTNLHRVHPLWIPIVDTHCGHPLSAPIVGTRCEKLRV